MEEVGAGPEEAKDGARDGVKNSARSDGKDGAHRGRCRARGGEILLDVTGIERLFGSPAGIAAGCARRAERVGFEVGVGIADGPSTARIAALGAGHRGEAIVVPEGGDAEWLARLPLSALAPVAEEQGRRGRPSWEEIHPTLLRLGVERIGDLARLPLEEVSTRFGAVEARLVHRRRPRPAEDRSASAPTS